MIFFRYQRQLYKEERDEIGCQYDTKTRRRYTGAFKEEAVPLVRDSARLIAQVTRGIWASPTICATTGVLSRAKAETIDCESLTR
ncbi:MAG: hypothetical protein OJF51_003759 [Nitrospira sp.]|nr:MAG: hypothetical protein OJF51_003759 [Nitrospira sp.]